MRVFVGFGYNPRDAWIKDLVFPLVEAFGHNVLTGEDMHGEQLSNIVRDRIASCGALLGFLTRRDQMGNGKWTTHRWVTDELASAITAHVPAVEVRESGVDEQDGVAGDRQRIEYDENRRDRCLVEIVKALGRWPRGKVRLQLITQSQDEITEIIRLRRKEGFECRYRFMLEDSTELPERKAQLLPIGGGLFVDASDVPNESLISIQLGTKEASWVSDYRATDVPTIQLIREGP